MSFRSRLALGALVLLLALPGAAKEESKIKVRMDKVPGVGGPASGDIRTQMSANSATLHLKVKHLEPVQHFLLVDPGDGMVPLELVSFTPGGNGSANVRVDLLSLGEGEAADPRDRRLLVSKEMGDVLEEVLEVWIPGDTSMTRPKGLHLKERTSLAPGDGNLGGEGYVDALYQTNPSGKGRLLLRLRGVPAGSYDVYVGGAPVAYEVIPNAAGNAQVSFRTSTKSNGKMNGHNQKLMMPFDPFFELIELCQSDAPPCEANEVYFSGVMAAQVDGLNATAP